MCVFDTNRPFGVMFSFLIWLFLFKKKSKLSAFFFFYFSAKSFQLKTFIFLIFSMWKFYFTSFVSVWFQMIRTHNIDVERSATDVLFTYLLLLLSLLFLDFHFIIFCLSTLPSCSGWCFLMGVGVLGKPCRVPAHTCTSAVSQSKRTAAGCAADKVKWGSVCFF